MTVSSKYKRTSGASVVASGNVVELPSPRSTSIRSVGLSSRAYLRAKPSVGATLLSVRQHLRYKASMGIDDLEIIEQSYSAQVAAKLLVKLREMLDQEFGNLRVHRRRQGFVVNHHCVESLIAGLLRVQFHSQQIALPATREGEGLSDICGVPLTWGIGTTLAEAEDERLNKLDA